MAIVVRRGRKRKAGARHPSGKLRQRTEKERVDEIVHVARSARQRVHGLGRCDAAQPEAGDMLGRLTLSGEVTRRQMEAGRAYAELRRDYDKALAARRFVSGAQLEGGAGFDGADGSEPAYRAWVQRVIDRFDRVRRAINDTGDPMAMMALDGIVLEDQPMWSQLGSLRIGLNAVVRALGLDRNQDI